MNLEDHIRRQMAWSRGTFGPGERTKGICEHIGKELVEVVQSPDDGKRSLEWVDVAILSIDGLWRAMEAEGARWDAIPELIVHAMAAKQSKNEQRTWPDWRGVSQDAAIEHDRSEDDT